MKTLIVLAMILSLNAYADDKACSEENSQTVATETREIKTDVPRHLKGAVIIVRQADGRESTVPAERFKVVPRKQQFIVTKLETSKVTSCVTNEPRKNRVSLLGGYGARNGLTTTRSGNSVTVESSSGAVGGLQYQRMLNNRWSLGAQGQTNNSGSLLLGLDF